MVPSASPLANTNTTSTHDTLTSVKKNRRDMRVLRNNITNRRQARAERSLTLVRQSLFESNLESSSIASGVSSMHNMGSMFSQVSADLPL